MDATASELGGSQIGALFDADLRARSAWTALEDDGAKRRVVSRRVIAGLPEVEDIGEYPSCRSEAIDGQGDMVEPADLVFQRDRAPSPGGESRVVTTGHQGEALPFRIGEAQRRETRDLRDAAVSETSLVKTPGPPIKRIVVRNA